jgi:hypothetical protein
MQPARFVALFACLTACSSDPTSTKSTSPKSDDPSAPPSGNFGDAPPSGETPPTEQTSEVFSHSADTLYRIDPTTKAVAVVGRLEGCTSDLIDIALDADSNLFGTTYDGLWRIDRKSAACTKIAGGSYPNSLSFVPKGTVDANAEALVGYADNDDYVRIDTTTGKMTKIGSLGAPGLSSSGDIVSVKDGPTYLSVVGNQCDDCIVEVNPKTGGVVKNWGSIGHPAVYGLAFWAGSVYAFDEGGELFEVTFAAGKLATKALSIPDAKASLSFLGAGSTTSAPVTPPH